MARFAWYSQVIRSPRGARFDAIAEEICFHMLEKGKIHTYSQLMEMIANDPDQFYTFNDNYFMQQVHLNYTNGSFDKTPRIKDLAHCLLFEKAPRTVKCEEFKQRILNQDEDHVLDKILKHAQDKIKEIKEILKKKGTEKDWIVEDLPTKHIVFVKSRRKLVKGKTSENLLLERDPAKIIMDSGDVKLLGDVENSIISDLQQKFNFVPNVYCSDSAYELLKMEGIIT